MTVAANSLANALFTASTLLWRMQGALPLAWKGTKMVTYSKSSSNAKQRLSQNVATPWSECEKADNGGQHVVTAPSKCFNVSKERDAVAAALASLNTGESPDKPAVWNTGECIKVSNIGREITTVQSKLSHCVVGLLHCRRVYLLGTSYHTENPLHNTVYAFRQFQLLAAFIVATEELSGSKVILPTMCCTTSPDKCKHNSGPQWHKNWHSLLRCLVDTPQERVL